MIYEGDAGDETAYESDRADIASIMRIASQLADALMLPDPIPELLEEGDAA